MRVGILALVVALADTEPAVEVTQPGASTSVEPAVADLEDSAPKLQSGTPGVESTPERSPSNAPADASAAPAVDPDVEPATPTPTYAVEGSGGVAPAPVPADPTADYAPDPQHRRLQVGGAAAVGVGCGAFIAMVAGLAVASGAGQELDLERQRDPVDPGRVDDLEQRQRLGRGLAIGGGAAAGVLIVSGVAMMAVGYKRARLHYEAFLERQADRSPRLELAGGPGDVGTALRLRF